MGLREIETNIFAAQVFREVLELPEAQRETVLLVYVEGLTYREAADVLNVPMGTIMSRLAAARLKLSELNAEIPDNAGETRSAHEGGGKGEISLDAILVAYLDGELEPEAHEKLERLLKSDASVRERLAMLSRGARPFKRTFDAVLDSAPRERLQAQLAASVTKFARPSWLARSRRWGMAIAAALLLVIGAGAVGYLLGQVLARTCSISEIVRRRGLMPSLTRYRSTAANPWLRFRSMRRHKRRSSAG